VIEDMLRTALQEASRAAPIPADPAAWVRRRLRRQRAWATAASATVTAALVLGVVAFVGPGQPRPPEPVVAPGLGWAPRGPLAQDPAVVAAATSAWDEAAGSGSTLAGVGALPARSSDVRVLWAGDPPIYEHGGWRVHRRVQVAVVEGEAADGTSWVVVTRAHAADEQTPVSGWRATRWGQLPAEPLPALLVDAGPTAALWGDPAGAEVHVLTAPGAELAVRQDTWWLGNQALDGLAGPMNVHIGESPASAGAVREVERVVLRAGDQLLAEPCQRRLSPVLEPVGPTSAAAPPAGWTPLGPAMSEATLADDALRLLVQRCTSRATAAPLWSGTLASGRPARVVSLAVPGRRAVAGLTGVDGSITPHAELAAGPAEAPVVRLLAEGDMDQPQLIAIGSEAVARLVLEGPTPREVHGRVLVQVLRDDRRGTLVAYDASGRELLRRTLDDPAWAPTG
jgi:hypothetical protein